ncbi:MAG: DUF4166 domain-containing protein [Pseudomonas sp.]
MNALIEHLGVHFEQLPPLLQRAHQGAIRLTGSVAVVRGSGLAWLLGKLLGMPEAGTAVPLVVKGQHSAEAMIWQRDFAGRRLISHFRRNGDYLLEKMGPITLWMRLRVEPGRLVCQLEQVSLFGFTLPQTLAPQLVAFEAEESQR